MSDTSIPYPWVEYDTLSDAIDTIGSNETEVHIYNQQNVTDDLTIPSNITLKFLQGGTLNISATKTVTINGYLEAGLYQIFGGDGTVSFGAGSVKEIYPEWWGAVADDSTISNVAIQAAIDSLPATGGMVVFSSGTYKTTASITVAASSVHLRGNSTSTIIKGYEATNTLQLGNGTDAIEGGSVKDIRIHNVGGVALRGVLARKAHRYEFYNLHVLGGAVAGIEIQDCYTQRYYGGSATSCAKGIFLNKISTQSNDIQFFGTWCRGSSGIGIDDEGGSGRLYNVYLEENAGGGLHAINLRGFSITGGYFEHNDGYDVKIDTGCSGGTVAPGYLTNHHENDHKCIWLNGCINITVGMSFIGGHLGITGFTGIYVDADTSNIAILPFTFYLDGGATGDKIAGANVNKVIKLGTTTDTAVSPTVEIADTVASGVATLQNISTYDHSGVDDWTMGVALRLGYLNQDNHMSRLISYFNPGFSYASKLQLQTHSGNSGVWNTGLFMDHVGNVGIGTTIPVISDGIGLHLNSKIIRIAASKTPSSAGDTGNIGEICWDANYIYVCVDTDTWKRVAIATW